MWGHHQSERHRPPLKGIRHACATFPRIRSTLSVRPGTEKTPQCRHTLLLGASCPRIGCHRYPRVPPLANSRRRVRRRAASRYDLANLATRGARAWLVDASAEDCRCCCIRRPPSNPSGTQSVGPTRLPQPARATWRRPKIAQRRNPDPSSGARPPRGVDLALFVPSRSNFPWSCPSVVDKFCCC